MDNIINDTEEGRRWLEEAAKRTGEEGGNSSSTTGKTEGTTGAENQKKKSIGLSLLNKEPKEVPINIPGIEGEEKTKKKKKRSSKKSRNSEELETLVNGLLTSIFYLAAQKDPEVWSVSPQEVQTIAEPAGKILAKMDKSGKVGTYSDGISLVLALLIVVGTRAVKTANKKKTKAGGVKLERNNARQNQTSNGENNSSNEPPSSVSNAFANTLPAVG